MIKAVNAASLALIRGDEVLLIQRARAPYRGLWTLPGGRLDPGETAEQAVVREVGEETGLRVGEAVPVLTRDIEADWRLAVFASTEFSGEVIPADEIATWCWVRPDDASGLPTTPGLAEVLDLAFAAIGAR
jgi:8-oxo-dGTP diphosphatase